MQSCLVHAFQLPHSFQSTFPPLSPAVHSNMHVCLAHTHCSHCLLYLRIASEQSHSSRRDNRWQDGELERWRQIEGENSHRSTFMARQADEKMEVEGRCQGEDVSIFAYCIHTDMYSTCHLFLRLHKWAQTGRQMERKGGECADCCVHAVAAVSVYIEVQRRGACTSSPDKQSDSAVFVPGVA